MLLARYRHESQVFFGILEGQALRRLPGDLFAGLTPTGITDQLADVELLAPVGNSRIFAVGMNYVGHIAEAGAPTPEIPLIFMMPSTAVIGPGQAIVLPLEAQIVHHECELAIVIGAKARRVPPEAALDCVLGYTCGNDVSERVIQNREMASGALVIGKGFDTFCPLGPVIATGLDPADLEIETYVNGQLRQRGNTRDLLFDAAFLISYISQAITLLPGDVILTGTPSGVGPLVAGDICDVVIQGIGKLSNPVEAEQPMDQI